MPLYLLAVDEDEDDYAGFTPEQAAGVIAAQQVFLTGLKDDGMRVEQLAALGPRADAWFVRPGDGDSAAALLDDPHVHGRSSLGALYLVEARSDEQAVELAGRCPVPFGYVEVRRVLGRNEG